MQAALLTTLVFFGLASCVSYEGYKLYKVVAKDEVENQYLLSLETNGNYNFWSAVNKAGNPVLVMASPEVQREFERHLEDNKIEFYVAIENVESVIQSERLTQRSNKPFRYGNVTYGAYPTYAQIIDFLRDVAVAFPTKVRRETLGLSFENRSLDLVRISSDFDNPKRTIFVDAGIHAREWIAPVTALYLIEQLVQPQNEDLIQDLEWIILPLVNPDGYDYTFREDRFWRKTRSRGIQCDGVDANRNFGYEWGVSGASKWECSDIYAGPAPFSDLETNLLQQYILDKAATIEAYLTLHSYGAYLLYPWGYTNENCDDWEELRDLGNRVKEAIESYAEVVYDRVIRYSVGGAAELLYDAAGASDDWAKGAAKIHIVYTIELPGGGTIGFDLPEDEIQEVVEETFAGFRVVGEYVIQN